MQKTHHPRTLALLVLALFTNALSAQRISRDYHETSLSDILVELSHASSQYKISFIYNELEDFSVTHTVHNRTIPDAIGDCIGFYPIRMTVNDSLIFVECTQKQERRLIGRLIDEQGHPIAFANITILSPRDTCFINGGVSNEGGLFVIPCDEREALVRVTYIGYKTLEKHVRIHDVGTWQMTPEAFTLNGVEVKGDIPRLDLRGASLVMTVENTVLERLGTAEDILCRIPTVIKNGDKFEVLGKGAPTIYINGRQVRDPQELGQLQSDQIKNVEVVQNPGARYDATVKAVIVIHTKRPQGEGLGVELSSYSRKSRGGINNERVNLTYRTGGLEVFAMGFGAYNDIRTQDIFNETTFSDTIWTNSHEGKCRERNTYFEGKVGVNYQPNDRHSVGAFIQNEYDKINSYETNSDIIEAFGIPYDKLGINTEGTTQWSPSLSANLYYNGIIGKWTVDFNADLIHRHGTITGKNDEKSDNYDNRNVNTQNISKTNMVAEKLILSYPIGKGKLSVGEEYTDTKRKNMFNNAEGYLDNSQNETRERNTAPFIEWEQPLGKWHLSTGLRYEHTSTEITIGDEKQPGQSRTYDKLFPSLALSASLPVKIASKSPQPLSLSLSYASRTFRPTYNNLNGNIIYESRLNYQIGNPMLKPCFIHNISFMAMHRGFFLNVNFSRYNDEFFFTTDFYQNDPKINLVTFRNYPHRNQLLVTAGLNKSIGLKGWLTGATWLPQYSVSFMKQWFESEYLGEMKTFNRPIGVVQFNNVVNLRHDWIVTLDFMAFTTGNQNNSFFRKPKSMANLSLSKDFLDRRLNVKVAANDIFNGFTNRFTLYSNHMLFHRTDKEDVRFVYLSLRYRFNVTPSKYKGTGAGNAEKRRL